MAEICILTAEIVAPEGPWEMPRAPVMCKKFRLDPNGDLQKIPYDNAVYFSVRAVTVDGISGLAATLTALERQPNSIVIRGELKDRGRTSHVRRTLESFTSNPLGMPWVMLDIDGWMLPDNMDPLSEAAREHVVALLPEPFQNASYFYQYSASAGIRKPDGQALKPGLSIHLWFWLGGRLLCDKPLAAYFEKHCLDTDFLTRHANRAGAPAISYGIDLAVIRNPVQPHYVAPPAIDEGVLCDLPPEQRHGLVRKANDTVALPQVDPQLEALSYKQRQMVQESWKKACGWQPKPLVIKTKEGSVRRQSYLSAPQMHTGRIFREAKAYKDSAIILFFEEEQSPGSWYVHRQVPTVAVRFGDQSRVPLRELSEGAYQYVRSTLKWFEEIPTHQLALDAEGYLPTLSSFATGRNVHLIQAPTGSGKTRRIIDLVKADPSQTYFYAASTTPLCDQMCSDLQEAGVPVRFYQHVSGWDGLSAGVVVTTVKSLPKFIKAAEIWPTQYTLLIDEIHIALDEVQASRNRAGNFEKAIANANRCYLFTGTLTPVQLAMLGQVVESANRGVNHGPGGLVVHEFAPVHRRPLLLCAAKDFYIDLIRLLEEFQSRLAQGMSIPRTVIAVDTSKMRLFLNLLDRHALRDRAHVISRPESTVEDIRYATADVDRPILICSPLFSVGLNFLHPPEIFFVHYGTLQVDQNQIVQTLNRANRVRGRAAAQVRLYTHGPSEEVWDLVDRDVVQRDVATAFAAETLSVRFQLDEHFMIDRAAYNLLRSGERKTRRAMAKLSRDDAFQNFAVRGLGEIEAPVLQPVEDGDRNHYRGIHGNLKKQAIMSYGQQVTDSLGYFRGVTWAAVLAMLEHYHGKQSELRLGGTEVTLRDLEDKTTAGLMTLCGSQSVSDGRHIKAVRTMRFLSMRDPFVSGHFPHDRSGDDRNKVAAEKVRKTIGLTHALEKLKDGRMTGIRFAQWMVGAGRQAILALANNEDDYLRLSKQLDRLQKRNESKRTHAGKDERAVIDAELFSFAHAFLRTLGVTFQKKSVGRSASFDPTAPLVPDWDLKTIAIFQEQHALSLEARKDLMPERNDLQHAYEIQVSYRLCESCVHFAPDQDCRLYHPVENYLVRDGAVREECADHKRLPARLALKIEAIRTEMLDDPKPDLRATRPFTNALGERIVFGMAMATRPEAAQSEEIPQKNDKRAQELDLCGVVDEKDE